MASLWVLLAVLYFLGLVKSLIVFMNMTMTPVASNHAKNVLYLSWIALLVLGHLAAQNGLAYPAQAVRALSLLWFGGFILLAILFFPRFIRDQVRGRENRYPFIRTRDITKTLHPAPRRGFFPAPYRALEKLGIKNDHYFPMLLEHTLFLKDLPREWDGFRFLHLSDLHYESGLPFPYHRQMGKWIRQAKVKTIFFTGDFVSRVRDIPECSRWLRGLTKHCRVIAILGNHDYWTHVQSVVRAVRGAGVQLLVNQIVRLYKGRREMEIVGLDDLWRGARAPEALMNSKGFKLILGHTPDFAPKVKNKGFFLMLSGHTHAGQIRFPFLGPMLVPSAHSRTFDRGFFLLGGMLLYVNQGLGGLPRMRLNCRPEMSVFILKRGAPGP
jgi:predicted MPP superfamily phosphohydrolase